MGMAGDNKGVEIEGKRGIHVLEAESAGPADARGLETKRKMWGWG